MHQVVGDAIEVGIEGHVVVDVDAGAGPLAQIERLQRQRFQGRFVDRFEHGRPASIALAEGPVVQLGEQLADFRLREILRDRHRKGNEQLAAGCGKLPVD